MSIGIRKLLYLVVMVGLVGCQSTPVVKSPAESLGQIKKYYDSLQHPLDFHRSIQVLEMTDNNNPESLYSTGAYLISKGYKVTRMEEPRYMSSSENYSIYYVGVDITYPNDSKIEQASTTEHVWINDKTRKIYKIESEDVYISARADNYVFSGK